MPTINYNFKIDGFWSSTNYYRSLTPIDANAMPAPTATDIAGLMHSDTTAESGKYYFVRFGSVKGSEEKISEEIEVISGRLWNPSDMVTPTSIYLDSDSIVMTSSSVSQWTDKSGNGNHFTAPAGSSRPSRTMLNGQDVVGFNGTTNYLNNNNLGLYRNVGQGWLFSVSKRSGAARNVVTHNAGSASNLRLGHNQEVVGSARTDTGAIIQTPNAPLVAVDEWGSVLGIADWHGGQLIGIADGGGQNIATITTGNTSDTNSASGTTLGRFSTTSSSYAQCQIACLLMGVGALPTQDEINKLMGWAAHKWGLTDKLPIDHPYKYAPPVV